MCMKIETKMNGRLIRKKLNTNLKIKIMKKTELTNLLTVSGQFQEFLAVFWQTESNTD